MNVRKLIALARSYYRDLRPSELTTRKYSHILLIPYWGLFGAVFVFLERILPRITEVRYREIVCAWDARVPFCEWFVIPYFFWFVFLIGFGAFWFLFEPPRFREWMWTVILTYSAAAVIYVVYPNMQALRPVAFERDNLPVRIVQGLYAFDTNTNVCPSIHCLGSFATGLAGWRSRVLCGVGWKLFFLVSVVLICASTVLLKQHSVIDVLAAVAVSLVCGVIQYGVLPSVMTARGEA